MKNHYHQPSSSTALLTGILLFAGPVLHGQTLATSPAPGSGLRSFSSITGSVTGKTKLESGHTGFGEISSKEFTAIFRETVALSNQADLGLGLNYGRTSFDVASNGPASPVPHRLQSLALDLTYAQRFNDSWSGELTVSPGYHSAGTLFNSDSLGTTANLIGSYRLNPRLSFAAGAYFDSLAAGDKFHGLLAADWNPSTHWRVRLGFPKTAITYVFSDAFELSGFATGTFASYSVQDDPRPGLAGKPPLAHTKLDYGDTRVGLAATFNITRDLSLSATVGRVVEREFDYHQQNFKLRAEDGATYGSIGLTSRF